MDSHDDCCYVIRMLHMCMMISYIKCINVTYKGLVIITLGSLNTDANPYPLVIASFNDVTIIVSDSP